MSRIALIVTSLAMTTLGLAATEAVSAGEQTTCLVEHEVTLTPGLGIEGTSGTFEDEVLGTVSCDGPVDGVTPTGPGTLYDKGRYGTEDPDTCLGGGEGEGAYTIVLPTADGETTLVKPFTVTYGEPSTNGGVVAIRVRGEGMSGDLGGTPTAGDCVSAPVTKVKVAGKVLFG